MTCPKSNSGSEFYSLSLILSGTPTGERLAIALSARVVLPEPSRLIQSLADENFDNTIVRGLFHRSPKIDIVRVQDIGPLGKNDPTILDCAAQEGRILLTYDVSTIPNQATPKPVYSRIYGGCKPKIISSFATPIEIKVSAIGRSV